jgi:2-succinyl-5-enolpyruvyl-6-hydroxy-3-cyclohexene-1-carboxylate synthase
MAEVPTTTAATFCAAVVDEWVRCGLTDAVVAPGSRSTPMALALATDRRIVVHVHHDERSAGFLAVGLATATGRPAPVLTTSGTASVELHPAVVEAHHGRIPMICCTADRPPELHHVGAPQTVDQTRLYGDVVRWYVDLGVPDEAARDAWRSVAARTVAEATGSPPGPVQWNLPFRDPLVGAPGELPRGRAQRASWHRRVGGAPMVDADEVEAVVVRAAGARGVIVAGGTGRGGGVDPDAVHDLARALGWPVLADPRSGCRIPEGTTVSHADLLVRHEGFAERHRPEVVIQLGEPPASKVQAHWLRRSTAFTVVVDADGAWFDPDRLAAVVVPADPASWCRGVAARVREARGDVDDDWLESWAAADAAASTALATALARHDRLTEPAVARELVSVLGQGSCLVVSSSMPIRDVEWFSEARRGLRVVANRGANGIDGVVSTAVGVALGSQVPTALLVGDVALLHDINGLLGLGGRAPLDLTIVAVDNDGGGIFSFLPQAAQLPGDRFEQLFGTPHGVDLEAVAAVHGIPAVTVERPGEVEAAVGAVSGSEGVSLVVVHTDRTANVAVHDELNEVVAAALG